MHILEVCFGMGAGAVQTLEGLIQNRNDPPLLLQRWEGNLLSINFVTINSWLYSARQFWQLQIRKRILQETKIQSRSVMRREICHI